jgi:phage/plasmid-like protein (TIGR03299 family)
MAHEMTSSDQMYSVRQAPWHLGMGTNVLMLDTTPETRMDRMRLAGQDWLVEERELYAKRERTNALGLDDPEYIKLPGWKQVVRGDNGHLFACTQDTYTVVQNVVGHELFEVLSKGARLDDGTGGTVKSGAVCYLTARVDEPVFVKGDDSPVFPYVVVTWSHDGSGAVKARRTSIRVVCWNTLSFSEAQAQRNGTEFTFRHTGSVLSRIDEAKRVIEGARQDTAAFIELANELAAIPVTDAQKEEFVQTFIPAPATNVVISDRVLDNITGARNQVRALLTPGSVTIPEAHQNTAYGLVQAGVEYLDHLRGYRNSDTYLGRTLLRDEPLKAKLVPMVRELVAA